MDDNSEESIEPEAKHEQEKTEREDKETRPPPMRDEGLNRSASGALSLDPPRS
jgi:hypothetical protein